MFKFGSNLEFENKVHLPLHVYIWLLGNSKIMEFLGPQEKTPLNLRNQYLISSPILSLEIKSIDPYMIIFGSLRI